MKSILSGLLTGCILLTAIGLLKAQENNVVFNNKHLNRFTSAEPMVGSLMKLSVKEVNIRAVSDFVNKFRKTDSANWYKVQDGYIVNHAQNGDQIRTGYALNGNWLYNIASYTEEKMSREIWHLVKSSFYDFSITWVNEIEQASGKVYIVHLKNKYFFQNVRVCDGELDIIERLTIVPLPE